MSPDTFMSWRCPNGGLEIEGRSWVSHLFLSPAQGLRQPWIHIRYQLTVTELLNGNLLGLSALLNSTQLALPHGILSTSRYFMRVVTPSWLDRQSETKGVCLKPNTFTLLNFYNWDILLWMKLDKMTPSLRFVGLGKYSCWFCFVLFCLKTLKWTQQASWQEVRLRSLPQRMTQAKGEKQNKAAWASKSFCKALQSFPGFSGKRKKRKRKGQEEDGLTTGYRNADE